VLTTAEVLVGTSLLACDGAVVDDSVTDVTEPAATFCAPHGRTICPVRDSRNGLRHHGDMIVYRSPTQRHSMFHLEDAETQSYES